MTSLFLDADHNVRDGTRGHFFSRSVRKSQYLHIQSPWMFDVVRWLHFAMPASAPRERRDDLEEGMKEALAAWLRHAPSMLLCHQSHELRDMLGRSDIRVHMYRVKDHEVAKALYNGVKDGSLIFVPERDEMRKCVQAIREQREKASRPTTARAQQPADADMASSRYGNSPRVPQNLGNAKQFEYRPEALSDDVEQLADSTVKENYAAKMLGYERKLFGNMIHTMKRANQLRGDDNVIWHDDGGVEFKGVIVDNMHSYAP
ncbi:hypothetical protein OKW43_004647 [Paraburkholderia sp. WC7.3g]|uniref:hypothetical protein n=1 Tax=Paraburkholderia sp. WC7.3g TaxID=2991070 RepID=UPI003D1C27E7